MCVCGGGEEFGREEGRNGAYLDYRNLNIYAEGTWEKYEDLREYMLRSVSVEFEYIDKIYEENIKKGIIQNTTGEFQDLLTKLKSVESGKIAIIGVEKESLEVCNLLCKCGLRNIYFVSNEFKEEKRFIGGWPVLHEQQVRRMQNIIYLDCNSKYSDYGCSITDRYDYKGFRRNDRYFCVKDYIDIPQTNLEYILNGKDIILVGDIFLCKRFYTTYVKKFTTINAGYYNIFDDKYVGQEQMEIPFKCREKIKETDIVLIFSYRYLYGDENIKNLDNDNLTTEDYIEKLRSEGFLITFVCTMTFRNIKLQKKQNIHTSA